MQWIQFSIIANVVQKYVDDDKVHSVTNPLDANWIHVGNRLWIWFSMNFSKKAEKIPGWV